MRVLVTGGTGFIGSNITQQAINDGHEVLITGNDSENPIPKGVKKVLQPSFIGLDWQAIGKVDILFHQAAINDTTNMDEDEMLRANFLSTKELFTRVAKAGCKRIVYASSTAVYGDVPPPYKEDGPVNPLNPYAESKLAVDEWVFEEFVKKFPNVIVVGLRYCNVYGPSELQKGKRASMIPQLAQQMQKANPKLFEMGEQKRDYIYVKDVVRANLLASQAKKSCLLNCGSGKATSFNQLVDILNTLLKTKRTPIYIPNPYVGVYQDFTLCDMSKAKVMIGFEPEFSIQKGIADYAKYGFF